MEVLGSYTGKFIRSLHIQKRRLNGNMQSLELRRATRAYDIPKRKMSLIEAEQIKDVRQLASNQ